MVKLHMNANEHAMFSLLVDNIHRDNAGWPRALIVKWMKNKFERLVFKRASATRRHETLVDLGLEPAPRPSARCQYSIANLHRAKILLQYCTSEDAVALAIQLRKYTMDIHPLEAYCWSVTEAILTSYVRTGMFPGAE